MTVDLSGFTSVWANHHGAWVELLDEGDDTGSFEHDGPYAIAGQCQVPGRPNEVFVILAGAGDPKSWWLPCMNDGASTYIAVLNDSDADTALFLGRSNLEYFQSVAALSGGMYDGMGGETVDLVAWSPGRFEIQRDIDIPLGGMTELHVDPVQDGVNLFAREVTTRRGTIREISVELLTRGHTFARYGVGDSSPIGLVAPADLEDGDRQILRVTGTPGPSTPFATADVGPGSGTGDIEVDVSGSLDGVTLDTVDGVTATWEPVTAWTQQWLHRDADNLQSTSLTMEAYPGWISAESGRELALTLPDLPEAWDDSWELAPSDNQWVLQLSNAGSGGTRHGVSWVGP